MNYQFTTQVMVADLTRITEQAYQYDGWTSQLYAQDLNQATSRYLAIKINDEIIAFLGASLVLDEFSVTNLAVLPAWQGHRLGEILLKEAMRHLPQGTRLLLEVRPSNQKAVALYERIGFQTYFMRPKYYRDPIEDAYLMDYTIK
ncbi:ribosomal protein S18-alanine N-acetyltransferase [Weissella kandleri]|uniref:ribosomal protein S18-alanine N-acetyltransferase n=1 Tax=Weissella kandleri TaxID=1616 RepID=UPI00387E3369